MLTVVVLIVPRWLLATYPTDAARLGDNSPMAFGSLAAGAARGRTRLECRFGESYRHYKANAPRWLPRIGGR
ncbi:MAG: hypothetical protein ACREMX_06030 [Gemmatimonadales bacterium]